MNKFCALLIFFLITLSIGNLLSASAHADITLNFGIYTSDKPTEVVRQFKPVLRVLEASLTKKLGEPVAIRTHVSATYEKGIQALVGGHVDFARFGPASYIFAKQEAPDITILAIESKNGKKTFKGIICVPTDSPITNVSQLKGKTFAFGDERSTIGRYLSQSYLLEHGVAAQDLKSFEYLGRHDRVGTSVGLKKFDAGALKESTFNKLVAGGTPIRSIASFLNVTKPWLARGGLSQNILDAIRTSLLELKDSEALKILKKDGFVEGADSDYAVIKKSITDNSNFFK